MKLYSFCFLFSLSLITCTSPKNKPFDSMNEGNLAQAHFFFSLPYENSSDSAAVVTLCINGKRYRFMIDTGAPFSISQSLQKELNFPVLQDQTLRDANGDTTHVKIVRVNQVNIGPIAIESIPALVLDLESPLFACDRYDGLLGSNLLRLMVIQFNKPEKKILFGNNIDSFRLVKETTTLPMAVNKVQSDPEIVLHAGSFATDTVLYDTGDKSLYNVSKVKFDGFNLSGNLNRLVYRKGSGVGSQGIVAANQDARPSVLLKIDSLGVGNVTIKEVFSLQHYDNRSRMGRGLWNYGLVTMDYPHKNFYLSPFGKDMRFTAPPDFGFRYQERNGKLLATVVWEATEAFKCGLKPGDEISQFGKFIPSTTDKCDWEKRCGLEAKTQTLELKYKGKSGTINHCTLNRNQ